ncbi:MAG: thermonuclease family protein [Planctomycetota bacterium]
MPYTPYLDAEVERIARRHRRWRRVRAWGSVVVVVLVIAALWFGRVGTVRDDVARFDGKWFAIDRVIDGDTLRVMAGGESVPVRLLGIDTPEPNAPGGDAATEAARSAVAGKVLLQIDGPRTRDRYGRLLAYVYLSDTEMLNRQLVAEGLAFAYRPKPHPFARDFESAEARARRKQLGLWAHITDEQQPAWRQRWLEEQRQLRETARMPWEK